MIVVITGASKGLGKAFAKQFAANNTLLLCARNEQSLQATVTEIIADEPTTTIFYKVADLSKKDEAIAFGNWCLQYGSPNVLINNAGSFLPGSIFNEADGSLENMIETNLYSAYHVTRTLLPVMMKSSDMAKHIFNICSIASLQAYSNGGSYSISKFAMLGFSKNLREELKPYQIKVTSVMPGAVFTDSWAGSGVDEKRIMEADDVTKMVFAAAQLSFQACVEEIVLRPQLGDL